jgi:hypothetical protein
MRGHQPLVDMRLRGLRPAMVAINVSTTPDRLAGDWHEWEGLMPHLWVEPGDAIATLDLRCVFDLLVDVSGDISQAKRVRRVFEACVKAGAVRVLGALHKPKGESLEVVEYMDTAGVLTWT